MEPTSRESLRRAVRRAVHHACWQRLDGTDPHAEPHLEIEEACAEFSDAAIPQDEIRAWMQEDEAEFERAKLISELVARQVQQVESPPATAAASVSRSIRAESSRAEHATLPRRSSQDETDPRPPVRTAPSITSLLDEMLAQRSAPAAGQA